MDEQRVFKGVWIPADIWLNEELSIMEKVLFAEIDSLDGEDGCYASNEYFMKFFKVSESTITRGIATLKRLGYIESTQIGGRTRILKVVKMTTQGSQNDYSGSSKNEFLQLIENKKENSIEKPEPPASSKISHSRGFRRERQSLEDKLFSGEEIASQKKERKKSPKDKFRDECLDIIDKEYSDETKELLIEYFNFVTKVPEDKDNLCKRVKTTKMWRNKLNRLKELVEDGYDCNKLIQQSLDKKQYVFYPLQSVSKSNRHESLANDVVVSDPEWARKAMQEAIDNGEEFY